MTTSFEQTGTAADNGAVQKSSSYDVSAESPNGCKTIQCEVGGSSGGSTTFGVRGFAFSSSTPELALILQTLPGALDGYSIPSGDWSVVRMNVTALSNGPELSEIVVSHLDDAGDVVAILGTREPNETIDGTGVWAFDVKCDAVTLGVDESILVEVAFLGTQAIANSSITITRNESLNTETIVPGFDAGFAMASIRRQR